jgi:hypothetical protein
MRDDLVKASREGYRGRDGYRDLNKKEYGPKIHPKDYDSDDISAGLKSSSRNRRDGGSIVYPAWSIIKRLLKKHVGRPWDKVYSELCAVNTKNDIPADQFKDTLNQIVKKDILFVDGKPRSLNDRYSFYNYFYVNPDTGLLCYQAKKKRIRKPKAITSIKTDQGFEFELIDRVWYRIVYGTKEEFNWFTGVYTPIRIKKTCNKKDLKIIREYLEKHG